MNGYCVYILKGERYYIGSTNDLTRRLQEHRTKGYSSKRIGERVCIGYIPCETLQEARSLERSIKKSGHYERRINKSSNNIIPYAQE